MGMAASQARFLGLTARKTNVEYEGQQINQQRTTLSNQSANYYNQLLGMSVPVPPSVEDYTKTVYTFTDGALSNCITSLIAQGDGNYLISYTRSYQDDNSIVSTPSHVVTRLTETPINRELYEQFLTGTNGGCYTTAIQNYDAAHFAHTLTHMLVAGDYTTSDGNKLTVFPFGMDKNYTNSRWWTTTASSGSNGNKVLMDKISAQLVGTPEQQEIVDLLYEFLKDVSGGTVDATKPILDGAERGNNVPQARKDYLKNRVTKLINSFGNEADIYYIGGTKLRSLGKIEEAERDENGLITKYTGNDAYLSTLSAAQLNELENEENEYITMLTQKFGGGAWMVRYIQNTTSGAWEPYFYKVNDLENAIYKDTTSGSLSYIEAYKIGTSRTTNEIKGTTAKLEQDTSGRYINITLNPGTEDEVTYALTTETITDQDAYNDAMNQYEYDKTTYDKAIEDINNKIEITQLEDKNLELRLKQLDTEQDAISTEMDAVQRVIEKNVESTFKIFG